VSKTAGLHLSLQVIACGLLVYSCGDAGELRLRLVVTGGGGEIWAKKTHTKRLRMLGTGAVREQEQNRQVTRALALTIRVLLRASNRG
jgi:hypothetical protein